MDAAEPARSQSVAHSPPRCGTRHGHDRDLRAVEGQRCARRRHRGAARDTKDLTREAGAGAQSDAERSGLVPRGHSVQKNCPYHRRRLVLPTEPPHTQMERRGTGGRRACCAVHTKTHETRQGQPSRPVFDVGHRRPDHGPHAYVGPAAQPYLPYKVNIVMTTPVIDARRRPGTTSRLDRQKLLRPPPSSGAERRRRDPPRPSTDRE